MTKKLNADLMFRYAAELGLSLKVDETEASNKPGDFQEGCLFFKEPQGSKICQNRNPARFLEIDVLP